MNIALKVASPAATVWQTVQLSEICLFKPPKSIPRKRLTDDTEVSFVPMNDLGELVKYFEAKNVRNFGEVVKGYTYFADGDVLCAKITPCFENGKLGIARDLTNGVGFGSSEFVVMRPESGLLPEFLYYYLSRDVFREVGARVMSGAVGHKRVPKAYFENLPISLPPLEEQKRIVAVLDRAFAALDRARAHAEANLADAKVMFSEVLRQQAAAQALEFGTVELNSLAEHITDGDHQPPPKVEQGVPFITISNIEKTSRQLLFENTFFVSRAYFQNLSDKRKPRSGDVLYTVTGSFGIPVLVRNTPDFCFQRHIALVRPSSPSNSEWLHFMLMSPQCFEQADAGASGTAQRTVSLKLLRSLKLPNTPSALQGKIASELNEVWRKCLKVALRYEKALSDITDLRQSFLQQAFSGQLI